MYASVVLLPIDSELVIFALEAESSLMGPSLIYFFPFLFQERQLRF